MIELIWSPQALADVEEIRAYIAVDSRLYADLTVQRILAAAERLRAFPDSGRMVPERPSPELREVIAGKWASGGAKGSASSLRNCGLSATP